VGPMECEAHARQCGGRGLSLDCAACGEQVAGGGMQASPVCIACAEKAPVPGLKERIRELERQAGDAELLRNLAEEKLTGTQAALDEIKVTKEGEKAKAVQEATAATHTVVTELRTEVRELESVRSYLDGVWQDELQGRAEDERLSEEKFESEHRHWVKTEVEEAAVARDSYHEAQEVIRQMELCTAAKESWGIGPLLENMGETLGGIIRDSQIQLLSNVHNLQTTADEAIAQHQKDVVTMATLESSVSDLRHELSEAAEHGDHHATKASELEELRAKENRDAEEMTAELTSEIATHVRRSKDLEDRLDARNQEILIVTRERTAIISELETRYERLILKSNELASEIRSETEQKVKAQNEVVVVTAGKEEIAERERVLRLHLEQLSTPKVEPPKMDTPPSEPRSPHVPQPSSSSGVSQAIADGLRATLAIKEVTLVESQQRNKEEAAALAWVRAHAAAQTQEAATYKRQMNEHKDEASEAHTRAEHFRSEAAEAVESQSTLRDETHSLREEIEEARNEIQKARETVKKLDCQRAALRYTRDLLPKCQPAPEVPPTPATSPTPATPPGPAGSPSPATPSKPGTPRSPVVVDHTACEQRLSESRQREEALIEELAAAQNKPVPGAVREVVAEVASHGDGREKILVEELAAAEALRKKTEATESAECVRLLSELSEATEQHELKQRKQKEELDLQLRIVRQEYASVWVELAATAKPGCVSVWTCCGWFCVPRCCCRRRDAVAPLPLFDPKLRGD